jgi:conjugative transfer signal peptidase TraF
MKGRLWRRCHPTAVATLALISSLPTVLLVGGLCGYRINLTPSEPIGLWRIEPLARALTSGDLVFLCPPLNSTMEEALRRGYLRPGPCPGRYAPLIKSVAGVAGQRVTIVGSVEIDGIALPSSALSRRDGMGRPLTPYAGGEIGPGEIFLFSAFAGSFDSRYFGPVPSSGVLGLARQVLTYAP